MKIVKFNTTKHHVDHNGTLSVLIDDDTILKISPLDTIFTCLDQAKKLVPDDRTSIVKNIVDNLCETMEIPISIRKNVLAAFDDRSKINLTEKESIDTLNQTSSNQQDKIKKEWLDFVELFVNEECPVGKFPLVEIEQVLEGEDIASFFSFIGDNYDIKEDNSFIIISMKKD